MAEREDAFVQKYFDSLKNRVNSGEVLPDSLKKDYDDLVGYFYEKTKSAQNPVAATEAQQATTAETPKKDVLGHEGDAELKKARFMSGAGLVGDVFSRILHNIGKYQAIDKQTKAQQLMSLAEGMQRPGARALAGKNAATIGAEMAAQKSLGSAAKTQTGWDIAGDTVGGIAGIASVLSTAGLLNGMLKNGTPASVIQAALTRDNLINRNLARSVSPAVTQTLGL